MTMDAKKIIWAYLIKDGVQTNQHIDEKQWNYYAGNYEKTDNYIKFLAQDIDLYQTQLPHYIERNEFVGTGSPSGQVSVLEGTLVLNNGNLVYYGKTNPDTAIISLLEKEVLKNKRDYALEATQYFENKNEFTQEKKFYLHAVCWTERETGWGQRPDGYTFHENEIQSQNFVKEFWAKQPKETPNEYSAPDGEAKIVEVSESLYNYVMSHGSIWLHYNDLKSYKTFDASVLKKKKKP